jgi:hypothetical protein
MAGAFAKVGYRAGFLLSKLYIVGMSDQSSPGRPGRPGRRGWPGWRRQPGHLGWRVFAIFAIALCLAVIGVALGLIFKW